MIDQRLRDGGRIELAGQDRTAAGLQDEHRVAQWCGVTQRAVHERGVGGGELPLIEFVAP